MTDNRVVVRDAWLVPAPRDEVYSIVSDFERMPERFPKVAREMRIVSRDGDRFFVEAIAASFGRLFPEVRIDIDVTLLPGEGYRTSTHNVTFNTTGEEQLLLVDDPAGTRIEYTYVVTVKNRSMAPAYRWMVATFGLPYWKRSFIDPLIALVVPGTS